MMDIGGVGLWGKTTIRQRGHDWTVFIARGLIEEQAGGPMGVEELDAWAFERGAEVFADVIARRIDAEPAREPFKVEITADDL